LLDHFPNGLTVVPPPDNLVEVSLKVLPSKIVVDPDQGTLHLGDHRLGRVHVHSGLWIGVFFLAMDHRLMVGHGLSESDVALAAIGH
jgi:hypothetical protein